MGELEPEEVPPPARGRTWATRHELYRTLIVVLPEDDGALRTVLPAPSTEPLTVIFPEERGVKLIWPLAIITP